MAGHEEAARILKEARDRGRRVLSEYDAKAFLGAFGIPVCREVVARDGEEAVEAARGLGYPVVLKGLGERLTHKTELGAVSLHLADAAAVRAEAGRILKIDGCEALLVQEMVKGLRELVCGLLRDPHFGPCVMFGLGGILTEILRDNTFRVAPLTREEASAMMEDIRGRAVLEPFRGEAAVDRETLCGILTALGEVGIRFPEIAEIDINPLKIRPDGKIAAVDALVVLAE
ncbi:MAG TPA: acetate--CoA ligase family protein [Syntrophales bacterium]|nr:acetate--CoA ligase family protein [Syntrophales bacterium]HOM08062.1 acetate--CoA ligase family protein [Syntrophales bacterium]HON99814.1 acetate--CoA ligase family protein [Syntrophales bacterium]HPC01469.1 acetate--CoA ligase family protein [Syntrophales bacterium]HPQ07467.1 acetate--CoA ligase family protein [Syntrophales bacterium]